MRHSDEELKEFKIGESVTDERGNVIGFIVSGVKDRMIVIKNENSECITICVDDVRRGNVIFRCYNRDLKIEEIKERMDSIELQQHEISSLFDDIISNDFRMKIETILSDVKSLKYSVLDEIEMVSTVNSDVVILKKENDSKYTKSLSRISDSIPGIYNLINDMKMKCIEFSGIFNSLISDLSTINEMCIKSRKKINFIIKDIDPNR